MFVYLFSAASFDFYLINFYLKYIPGNVFVNAIVASISASIATCLSGILIAKLGSRNGMCSTFGLCAMAGILLFIAESSDWLVVVPFAVLAAQFGCNAAFTMLYIATIEYFPPQFMGTVFGVCNVTARSITILSPMVAEAPRPTPTILIVASCFGAVLFSRCL